MTIRRALIIDVAKIICAQEGTRSGFHYKVTIFINLQVGFNERAFLHSQVLRNPFYIRCLEPWGKTLAAISAGKAIYLVECFFM